MAPSQRCKGLIPPPDGREHARENRDHVPFGPPRTHVQCRFSARTAMEDFAGGAAYDMLLSPMPGKVNWSQAMGKSQAALVPAPAVAPAYSPAAPALASSAEDTPAYEAPPPSRGGKKKKKGSDDEEEDGRV